ncbi:MAG: gamma-butyrobetaine hydroxylase-like domain-containing protein [Candidatus Puniceispirillales bacterium]
MTTTTAWPTDITLSADKTELTVIFEDGCSATLAAELLRVESPSAEVQGHAAEEKQTLPGKKHVLITGVEPVGHYAVRLIFSDGHDTGLFSWDILYRFANEHEAMMADYLSRVESLGLSRDANQ